MAQRRHHYEKAFEDFLRARRIPYVAVNEAKKALLPESAALATLERDDAGNPIRHALKSFDFVLYGGGVNLLAEVKGRRIPRARPSVDPQRADAAASVDLFEASSRRSNRKALKPPRRSRLDTWVTLDDVESLSRWERLFGPSFEAAFIFVYWCDEQPPDALFEEVFEHRQLWYAIRAVTLSEYRAAMKVRSPRWRTVHLPQAAFDRISRPLAGGFRWANADSSRDSDLNRVDCPPESVLEPLG